MLGCFWKSQLSGQQKLRVMDENFIAYLYTHQIAPTDEVDRIVDQWTMEKNRGNSINFPQMAVKRGLLSKSKAREIWREIQPDDSYKKASKSSSSSSRSGQRRSGQKRSSQSRSSNSSSGQRVAQNTGRPVQSADEAESANKLPPAIALPAGILVLLAGVYGLSFVISKTEVSTGPQKASVDQSINFNDPLFDNSPSTEKLEREAAMVMVNKKEDFGKAKSALKKLLEDKKIDKPERDKIQKDLDRVNELEGFSDKSKDMRKRVEQLLAEGKTSEAEQLLEKFLLSHFQEVDELGPEKRRLQALRERIQAEKAKKLKEMLAFHKDPKTLLEPKSPKIPKPGTPKSNPKGPGKNGLRGRRQRSPGLSKTYESQSISKIPLTEPKPLEVLRRKSFTKELWERRLKRAQKWVREQKVKLKKEIAAEQQRILKRSKDNPIEMRLTDAFVIRNGHVKEVDRFGFSIKTSRGTIGYRWDLAQPELALKVRKLALDENSAISNYRFARFCLKNRFFREARKAFKRAVARDRNLKTRVPRIDVIEKAANRFRGRCDRVGGGLVRFIYDFEKKDQLRDFVAQNASANRGRLYIPSPGANYEFVSFRQVYFIDFARATLDLAAGKQGGGIAFENKDRAYFMIYDPQGLLVMREQRGQSVRDLFQTRRVKANARQLRMTLRSGQLNLWVDGRVEARVPIPRDFDRITMAFSARSKRGTGVIDEIRFEGRMSPTFIRKTFQEADDIIAAELADAAGVGAPLSAWRRRKESLSAEDPIVQRTIKASSRAQIARARARLLTAREASDFERAWIGLGQAITEDPSNPVAYYEMAALEIRFGQLRLALLYLNKAVRLCGGFHEALALRSVVLCRLERFEEAKKDVERALAIRPESQLGLLAKGEVLYHDKKLDEAREMMEVAFALWPRNQDIGERLRNFTHVVEGPPWKRTYEVKTLHYRVMSDISKERTEFYAQHLEWIRSFYEQVFPFRGRDRRATALIFNTQEGYQQYADLTRGSRVESTLGYYHRGYDQLLLWEDREGDIENGETLDTLYHEGFHQYISRIVKDLPIWLNEGLAEYFGPTQFDRSGQVIKAGAINTFRLEPLQQHLKRGGKFYPFADIMNQSPRQFMGENASFKYSQVWSMIHFFSHARGGQPKLLRQYFDLVRDGKSAEHAFASTYGQLQLSSYEKRWLAYVKRMRKQKSR